MIYSYEKNGFEKKKLFEVRKMERERERHVRFNEIVHVEDLNQDGLDVDGSASRKTGLESSWFVEEDTAAGTECVPMGVAEC